MLVKLVLAAVLTVGVLGHVVPEQDRWFNSMITSDYCEKDKIQQVQASLTTFKQCVTNMFTSDESFINEMRQAALSNNKQAQQADVIKAFCARSPQLKSCIRPLLTSMSPCFTASGLRTTQQDMDKVLDLMCANNGAKLTLFLKEGGQECMEQKRLDFAACKDTKVSSITQLVGTYGSGPAIPEQERCKLDHQENVCTVAAMKTCSNPVPGNIIEEIVNKLDTSCNDVE